MQITSATAAHNYYHPTPTSPHTTGDIWTGLPTHSLLGLSTCAGLVITPACDLANYKADVVTYLPIVSLGHFLSMPALYNEVRSSLMAALDTLSISGVTDLLPKSRLPEDFDLNQVDKKLGSLVKLNAKQQDTMDRCKDGINYLRVIVTSSSGQRDVADIPRMLSSVLPAKDWKRIRSGIITNAFRPDIHFLPADSQHSEWSAVPDHSVVLFRYPMSIPVALLDTAAATPVDDWSKTVDILKQQLPCAEYFRNSRPLKSARVRQPFLGDILTRFVGLYVRLGSPDFTNETVDAFATAIGGASS